MIKFIVQLYKQLCLKCISKLSNRQQPQASLEANIVWEVTSRTVLPGSVTSAALCHLAINHASNQRASSLDWVTVSASVTPPGPPVHDRSPLVSKDWHKVREIHKMAPRGFEFYLACEMAGPSALHCLHSCCFLVPIC